MILSSRKLGVFFIPLDCINSDPASVRAALRDVIVVEARLRIEYDDVQYIGICDEFTTVEIGNTIPMYKAVLTREPDGTTKMLRWDMGILWEIYQGRQKVT
jgi:hypothetical protein